MYGHHLHPPGGSRHPYPIVPLRRGDRGHSRPMSHDILPRRPVGGFILHAVGMDYPALKIRYIADDSGAVSYTHLRAHETKANLVCRLLLEKKKKNQKKNIKS